MSFFDMTLRSALFIALFTALIIVGAFIHVPVPLVPITLQTLFVFLAALFLGAKFATFAVLLYILMGIVGLPVFAGGTSSIAHILAPSGGFIIAFIPASFIIGILKGKPKYLWHNVIICILATLVVYAIGTAWFHIAREIIHQEKQSWMQTLQVTVLPFLIGDGLKIFAACFLYRAVPIQIK